MEVKFVTVIEPKPCPRPRLAQGNHVYMPSSYRQYQKAIVCDARQAMGNRKPLTAPLACVIDFYAAIPKSWSKRRKQLAESGKLRPTSKRRGDLDNLMKGVLDSCNGIVYADDSQVVSSIVRKHYAAAPCIVVRFLDNAEAPYLALMEGLML